MLKVSTLFGRGSQGLQAPIGPAEGPPLKILVRGDCTSRRSLKLNGDMFAKAPQMVQNQKSTFVQFLDAAYGITVPDGVLEEISDVASMPGTLSAFYLGQANRSVLAETGADLLMLDTWGDLNFPLWEHRSLGYKIWINRKFLRDPEAFERDFVNIGRRTLKESIDDAVTFIRLVRRNNPGLPVLFLNQQVDHYPKLPEERTQRYGTLGAKVAERIEDVYFGGVLPKKVLELADIGSAGGAGNTLHFQGPTYRRMWDNAADAGLAEAIERRRAAVQAGEIVPPTEPWTFSVAAYTPPPPPPPGPEFTAGEPLTFHSMLQPDCTDACRARVDGLKDWLSQYVSFDGGPGQAKMPRLTPMVLDLTAHDSFEEWEASIKKMGKGAKLRQKRKAGEMGYYSHLFVRAVHVPDIYELNTSMESRSGGEIRSNLKRTIEDMGGPPKAFKEPKVPACPYHWNRLFGVFEKAPGHTQGDLVVDERLVGYVNVARCGDWAIDTQFIGHGDHIRNGVMTLLHHDIVEFLRADEDGAAAGLDYLMYGAAENGTAELFRFKRQSGFEPHPVDIRSS